MRKEGPVLHSGGKLLLVSATACILTMTNGEQPGFSWVLYWTAKGVVPLLLLLLTQPVQPRNKLWSKEGLLTLQKTLRGQEIHKRQIRKGKGKE